MRRDPAVLCILLVTMSCSLGEISLADDASTYRHFEVVDKDGQLVSTKPLPDPQDKLPRWARNVRQERVQWDDIKENTRPFFSDPQPFVVPPVDKGEPFHPHNHQPSITWLPNGDLLAIWYSTKREVGTELTVLASRLRLGQSKWEPSSEFFKAENRNMHGSSVFFDGEGTIYHMNGMGPVGGTGWSLLALLLRTSTDNGVTWTAPRAVSSGRHYQRRHQVIDGMFMTRSGALIQACDATPGGEGPTAIHVSRDGGATWKDPGGDIRGIHAGVAELKDGRLYAFGRAQLIEGKMPVSRSTDGGATWTTAASPFPPIGGGQRLVLRRLLEGPLLFVSFTSADRRRPESAGLEFVDADGKTFIGHGMFAALSFDEGETWPVRKLLTPGDGVFDGGAHTQAFRATPTRAEHAGYLAATQTPDGTIHLISSRLYYRFNLAWLRTR